MATSIGSMNWLRMCYLIYSDILGLRNGSDVLRDVQTTRDTRDQPPLRRWRWPAGTNAGSRAPGSRAAQWWTKGECHGWSTNGESMFTNVHRVWLGCVLNKFVEYVWSVLNDCCCNGFLIVHIMDATWCSMFFMKRAHDSDFRPSVSCRPFLPSPFHRCYCAWTRPTRSSIVHGWDVAGWTLGSWEGDGPTQFAMFFNC